MPRTDDEIREKYLERAIRELNRLTRDLQDCSDCPRGSVMPVLGSGHPQADVMLLKQRASTPEIEEGVAFYGRSGNAITKSLKRMSIEPIVVYGTLCVKCPVVDPGDASSECRSRLAEEISIVQPRCIVVMGAPAVEALNSLQLPLAEQVKPIPGEIQKLTPTIDLVYTPDIDQSLDAEDAKRDFWRAFRVLGEWYEDLPPY